MTTGVSATVLHTAGVTVEMDPDSRSVVASNATPGATPAEVETVTVPLVTRVEVTHSSWT